MTSKQHRILLIEDDPSYSAMLSKRFAREGFEALSAATGRAGLVLAESRQPHLILLDIKLPDTDGIRLYNTLRQSPKTAATPIIIITGLDMLPSVQDSIASDLKSEPLFCKDEGLKKLLQLIHAAIRPAEQVLPLALTDPGRVLHKGPLTVDLKTRQLMVENKTFPALAPQRFSLLCALIRSDGPVSREKLLLDIWGDSRDPKVVDVTIARLRRDLKRVRRVSIETTRHGYALAVEAVRANTSR